MSVLNIFDLDDTLFETYAQGYLVKEDGTREFITRGNYHNIRPKVDEYVDYSEYRSVDHFIAHHKLIPEVYANYKRAQELAQDCIILTARGRMDDPQRLQLFIKTSYQINVPIHFSGDLYFDNTKEAKKYVIERILSVPSVKYETVRFLDDQKGNLDGFLELRKISHFKSIKFMAYLVKNGKISGYETPPTR